MSNPRAPDAPSSSLRPLIALRAVQALLQNPEDTRQAFIITQALRGRSGLWLFNRFRRSPAGAEVLTGRLSLLQALSDRRRLDSLPRGTLGRTYAEFMGAENLTADGLVAASQDAERISLSADRALVRDRMRDMHDLYHVLSGYGRDPLGEICVLAFTFAQTRNAGLGLLVAMGTARIAQNLGRPGVWRTVLEAWRHGRQAAWFPGQPWEALMDRPLEALRHDLRVQPARHYPTLVRAVLAFRARNAGSVLTA